MDDKSPMSLHHNYVSCIDGRSTTSSVFLQVYNETLQEKLVTIMKNLNITFLWIGGLYNNTTFYNYKMPLHAVIFFLSAQVSHTEPGQVSKI